MFITVKERLVLERDHKSQVAQLFLLNLHQYARNKNKKRKFQQSENSWCIITCFDLIYTNNLWAFISACSSPKKSHEKEDLNHPKQSQFIMSIMTHSFLDLQTAQMDHGQMKGQIMKMQTGLWFHIYALWFGSNKLCSVCLISVVSLSCYLSVSVVTRPSASLPLYKTLFLFKCFEILFYILTVFKPYFPIFLSQSQVSSQFES